LDSALGLAVEALAPWANVDGASAKARKGKAILRQALDYFACSGGGDFAAFLGLLAALPLEVSQIDRADQIAAELGQLLTAAMINDPLFAGRGESADPGQLLSPSAGKRARVSVISFIGLSDEARPDSALSSPPRHRAACTTTSRETPQRSSSGESTAHADRGGQRAGASPRRPRRPSRTPGDWTVLCRERRHTRSTHPGTTVPEPSSHRSTH
jgi:hypothetical protein